jgi:hypothetical protein
MWRILTSNVQRPRSKCFGHVIGVKNASNFGNPVRFAKEKRRDSLVSTNYSNVQRSRSKCFGHVIGVKNASNFGNPVRFAKEKRRDYIVSIRFVAENNS